MSKMLFGIALIILGGCGIKESFQPLPPEYEIWSKSGATNLDVKKTMLECGMDNPFGSRGPKSKAFNRNDYYLSEFCMESQGYIDNFGMTVGEACKQHPDLPACQPGAVIPKPSVERRLNSKYCQSARNMINEKSYQRCLKVEAADPLYSTTEEDCVYEYKELRAECLP